MPRIKMNYSQYAEEDFRKEIYRQLTNRYESVSIRALAREVGVSQSSLNVNLRHKPNNLDVGLLRLIIPILKPDPGVVLRLLGYSSQDITRFKKQGSKEEASC